MSESIKPAVFDHGDMADVHLIAEADCKWMFFAMKDARARLKAIKEKMSADLSARLESCFADTDTALEMYEYLADKRMSCHEHAANEHLLTWEAEKKKGGNHGSSSN